MLSSTTITRKDGPVGFDYFGRRRKRFGRQHHWQTHNKLTAFSQGTVNRNLSTVHLHEPMHQCQSDAQPTLRAVQRTLRLCEEIENTRQKFRSDSDPRVTNCQNTVPILLLDGQPNVTTFFGVFSSVGEQVHDYLLQPGSVGVHPNWLWRQRNRELMSVMANQRANRLDCIFHDAVNCDSFPLQVDSSRGDAGHFHQVIDQMSHLSQLTLNDGAGSLLEWVFVLPQT